MLDLRSQSGLCLDSLFWLGLGLDNLLDSLLDFGLEILLGTSLEVSLEIVLGSCWVSP